MRRIYRASGRATPQAASRMYNLLARRDGQ